MSKLDLKPGDIIVYFLNVSEGFHKDYKEARTGVIQSRSEETSLSGSGVFYTLAGKGGEKTIIKAEKVISKVLVEELT